MIELVCIPCSLSGRDTVFNWDDTALPLTSRECPTCKSSATVAVDVFKNFAAARVASQKNKAAAPQTMSSATPTVTATIGCFGELLLSAPAAPATSSVLPKAGGKWHEHVARVRDFLRAGAPDLHSVNDWWDGTIFLRFSSWDIAVATHAPDSYDFVQLTLINKNGDSRTCTFYFDPEDEGMFDVGDVVPR